MRRARNVVASNTSLVAGTAGAEVAGRLVARVNAARDPVSWPDRVYMSNQGNGTMAERELHLLILEDAPADAELCQRELASAGLRFKARCVASRPAFETALETFTPDLIISDFSLPSGFDGLSALALARARLQDVPFIFVSGTIGEDRAVEAMKCGATDYVLKGHLQRLAPIVTRALQQARERSARRWTEEEIREREARFQSILQNLLDAFVTIDQNGAIIEWSGRAEVMFGWTLEEVKGLLLSETIIPERYRRACAARLRRFMQTSQTTTLRLPAEFHARRRNGSEFPVEVVVTPIKVQERYFFSAFIRDITQRVKWRQRLDVQHAIARVLAETVALEDVPSKLLQVTCETMGFTVGALWEVHEISNVLHCTETWHAPDLALERFAARTRESVVRPGAGIAGRAWQSGASLWIPGATINPRSPRASHAAAANLQENLAFPVTVRGKITGVLDFFGPEAREPERELLEVFATIGTQIGQFMERRDQHRKISRLNRIYAVLSSINSAIIRLKDRQELFKEACRIAVEHGGFGMAWIGMVDPKTLDVIPAAWAGIDSEWIAESRGTMREDVPLGQGLVGRALREKRPIYSNDIATEPTPGGARRIKAVRRGYHSLIVLPLVVDGSAVGNFALFVKEPSFFNEDEVALLEEVAANVSFALQSISHQEKLNYLAYYDALTGLPNRSLFTDRLEQLMHTARRNKDHAAAIYLDTERFRHVNDTLGRGAGDDYLRQVAVRLQSAIREENTVARIGADCFAVAVGGVAEPSDAAHTLVDRIVAAFRDPVTVEGQELRVALKAGIAVYPNDGEVADGLCTNAEAALKKAKATGERYLFYQPAMNARVAETLLLENKMLRALEKEQFVLHYQPKVELASGRVSGVEALIRWNDPETGLVAPMQFIPLLEETGMILEAGRWAIRQALQDYRSWRAEGLQPLRVAVNVSPIQLRQKDFVNVVREAIRESGEDPHGLDLEITESVIMDNIEENIEKLLAIRDLGINIAIDDFGTGYSSLGYLARLPVNALKIDRSFIITMDKGPEGMGIVFTIISLAHSLKLKVVAEGVDAEAQLQLLKLLNCDEIQGYLFSKPLAADDLLHFLHKNAA